jgi:hypothetical protein
MKAIVLGLATLAVVAAAVAFSRFDKAPGGLVIRQEKTNPWTALPARVDPDEFQFAIVSDRTGGHRARIFSRAVARLNLLQPEFVLSVGDLIEGGRKTPQQLDAEWREFDGYVKQLQMPFFYVPGNHDVANATTNKMWQERYGRRWYHFVYRKVLFLCLNTDDPPGSSSLGKEQVAWARKALADNKDVRWTVVSLHKPLWTYSGRSKNSWLEVEKALADRPYTVFCGHVHRYQKFVRQGQNYYQLATTGGGSKLRGVAYGEFDHVVWVTMKKSGPLLANVLLDSVLPDDLRVPESQEEGMKYPKLPKPVPVRGSVYLDGSPVVGANLVFTREVGETSKRRFRGDAMSEGDGSFVASTYRAFDGLPVGKYTVTVVQRRPLVTPEGVPGPNLLPPRYADLKTSPLVVEVREGMGEIKLELTR